VSARRAALALCAWGLLYAAYRAYYALGGTAGMFGVPRSPSQFRTVNGIATGLLLLAAVLPLLLARGRRRGRHVELDVQPKIREPVSRLDVAAARARLHLVEQQHGTRRRRDLRHIVGRPFWVHRCASRRARREITWR